MVRRVTTNGTMYSYKSTLQRTYRGLNDASNKVISNRQFTSYAEDPAAASRAFQLRRARWNTESQITSNESVTGKFSQGWDAIEKVYNDLGRELGEYSVLRGRNEPTGSGRKALGQSLIATAESIVFTMNTKYGDEHIFAGADGLRAPFAWDDDGDLTYRGYKVDIDPNDPAYQAQKAIYELPKESITFATDDNPSLTIAGETLTFTTPVPSAKDQLTEFVKEYNTKQEASAADEKDKWTASVNETGDGVIFTANTAGAVGGDGPADVPTGTDLTTVIQMGVDEKTDLIENARTAQEAIKKMLQETTFVDLGMGMEEDADQNIKPDTAFNSALCGLKYLGGDADAQDIYGGYGLDEDGDPRNFISLLKKAGELLYNTDENTGDWEDVPDADDMDRLINKIRDSLNKVSDTHVDLDTQVAFLKSNKDRLTELDDTLNDQIVGVEDMDPADAITSLMWAQYSYNAALKIGNGILSQSLLDYLS